MRLAWLRPLAVTPASPVDATAALIGELRRTHELDVYTRETAHDFVWTAFRHPYDVSVFELDNTGAHAFIWPYLLHDGGVLLLHSPTLHDARARTLVEAGRADDYAAEFAFNEGRTRRARWLHAATGDWPMLRAPVSAARVTVVPYRGLAEMLREQYPDARIACAPTGLRPAERRIDTAAARDVVTFGMLAGDRVDVARRALARAQAAGARAALLVHDSVDRVIAASDVVVVLAWPIESAAHRLAQAAMAAGAPVAALETMLSSDWPALDPQTWQPRRPGADAPAAVTIDLRDEEHSLAVAMRRLSAEPALRTALGDNARAWARTRHSVAAATAAWESILQEAARLDPPPRPAGWPPHLTADGTARARATLAEFGVGVDLF